MTQTVPSATLLRLMLYLLPWQSNDEWGGGPTLASWGGSGLCRMWNYQMCSGESNMPHRYTSGKRLPLLSSDSHTYKSTVSLQLIFIIGKNMFIQEVYKDRSMLFSSTCTMNLSLFYCEFLGAASMSTKVVTSSI